MTLGKPGDRQRWSLAHELAHLVMHYTYTGPISKIEDEADIFTAEFLVPAEAARNGLRAPLTLTLLAELKSQWGVSIQSLIMRAFQLEIITDGQRRYLFRQMATRGWLRNEPVPIPSEKPRLLRKMIESTYGFNTDSRVIADALGIPASMMVEILDGYRYAASQPKAIERESQPRTGRLLTMQPRIKLA
jgi:Zn-dependent peptidase ImmA (M78 family)